MSHGADGGLPDIVDVALVWGIWCLQLVLLMMMNAWHKREKKKNTLAVPIFYLFIFWFCDLNWWPLPTFAYGFCCTLPCGMLMRKKKGFSFFSTFSTDCTTLQFDHIILLNIAIQFRIVKQWFWSHLSAFQFEHVLSRAKLLHSLVFNCNQ